MTVNNLNDGYWHTEEPIEAGHYLVATMRTYPVFNQQFIGYDVKFYGDKWWDLSDVKKSRVVADHVEDFLAWHKVQEVEVKNESRES